MRNVSKILTVALTTAALAFPATATGSSSRYPKEQGGGGKRCKPGTSILELIFCSSGDLDSGYDKRKSDFDILRELVVIAGLAEALASLENISLFMPSDRAFYQLAKDLGYQKKYNEEKIVGYLAKELTKALELDLDVILQTVILYHVGDEKLSFQDLKHEPTIDTLLKGATIKAKYQNSGNKKRVILKHVNSALNFPRVDDKMRDLKTSQGPVHVITKVLVPVNL